MLSELDIMKLLPKLLECSHLGDFLEYSSFSKPHINLSDCCVITTRRINLKKCLIKYYLLLTAN